MIYLFKIVIFHTLLNYRRVFCTVIYPISADDQEGMNEQPMISVLPTNLSGTGMLSPFAEGMVGTAFHWSIVQAPPHRGHHPFLPCVRCWRCFESLQRQRPPPCQWHPAPDRQNCQDWWLRPPGAVIDLLFLVPTYLAVYTWICIYIYIRIYNYTYIYIYTYLAFFISVFACVYSDWQYLEHHLELRSYQIISKCALRTPTLRTSLKYTFRSLTSGPYVCSTLFYMIVRHTKID